MGSQAKIPRQLLNELKVLLTFIEHPKATYSEAVKLSGLRERTFPSALQRLRRKKVLQKNNKHYLINDEECWAFFSDLWKRLYPTSKRKLTRIEKEVERHSIDIEELFKKAKFESYEDFEKWFTSINNVVDIYSSERGHIKVDERIRKQAEVQEKTGVSQMRKMLAIKKYPDLQKIFEVNKKILWRIERESWKRSLEEHLAKGSKMPSYGRRIVREYCSECHREVDAVFDYESGEVVCMKCGTVITDVLIDKWTHKNSH